MSRNDYLNDIIDDLNALSLTHASNALMALYKTERYVSLDHIGFLREILTPECVARQNTRISNRLAKANLKGCPQDISQCVNSEHREYRPDRITDTLGTLDFVEEGLNVCILGPSDSGKSYLAKALGIAACMKYSVEYHHCEQLVETLSALKSTSYTQYEKKMRLLIKRDLLILDDFLLHTITEENEVKILFEIFEKRLELSNSTIVCSQREPKSWSSMILNDTVAADALMKRATKHYTVVIANR